MSGLIHIYTGDGKGKTSAAIGLGIRAYGRGFRILMVQFLKGTETGETKTLEKLAPGFTLHRGEEIKKFTWNMDEQELRQAKEAQQRLFDFAMDASSASKWDVLILDEIMAVLSSEMIQLESVIHFLKNKPAALEVVLTGRNAPSQLIGLADYVSEITKVKHPMDQGIPARKGIES